MPKINKNIKDLSQRRADYAYKCAKQGSSLSKNSEYKSYVKKIPMLIQTNGLSATLSFVKGKGGKTYNTIYKQIDEWLDHNSPIKGQLGDNVELVEKIIELNSENYQYTTAEVLSLFSWLRRFVDGLIKSN